MMFNDTETWHDSLDWDLTNKQMKTLDLFCGGGLSSTGAQSAGAELVAGIDMCAIATETYGANFPEATVLNNRLENINPKKIRDRIGDVDLILASPECTNHTPAKGGAARSEASRETALQILRFAKAFLPRWIVMENVIYMRPWSRYRELISSLEVLGYHVREQILDASSFGVPQRRKRLFVSCDREQIPAEIKPPRRIHPVTIGDILDGPATWKSTPLFKRGRAKDTIARAKRAIEALGEDKSFLIVYYGTDGCGGWQSLDRPLRTVTTVDRFALVQPTDDGYAMRMLQVPELKRAMGLKSAFHFPVGNRRDKIRLLGNGVCPPVMKAIVKSMFSSA